jgi:thioredoxin
MSTALFADKPVELDAAGFAALAGRTDLPVVVDFWAPWCGPCRIIGPIVEELAPNYNGKAVIGKVNVDDNPMIAQRFGVTSIPTLMMFKEGKLVDRAVGAMPKGELQKFIERNL